MSSRCCKSLLFMFAVFLWQTASTFPLPVSCFSVSSSYSSSYSSPYITRLGSLANSNAPSSSSTTLSSSLFNITLSFPCYRDLMTLQPGEFVTSEPFTVVMMNNIASESRSESLYDFCVKLYPRGGGHNKASFVSMFIHNKNPSNQQQVSKSGFGMSYQQQLLPSSLFGKQQRRPEEDEKVGAYLQFLPRHENDSVDATFALRLQGQLQQQQQQQQQTKGKKSRFRVEWKAGMRFVPLAKTKLAQGRANDFGAHFMQTQLLPEFLGIHDGNNNNNNNNNNSSSSNRRPVTMQVQVQIHNNNDDDDKNVARDDDTISPCNDTIKKENGSGTTPTTHSRLASVFFQLQDIRCHRQNLDTNSNKNKNDNDDDLVRVGRIVVPVLQTLSQRPEMFRQGIYPGVEYRILRIINSTTTTCDQDLFYYPKTATTTLAQQKRGHYNDDIDYELKPIYPLVSQLERAWPVRVKDCDIPKLLTGNQYNLLSALGSFAAATTALLTAFVISQAVSLFFIPSRSMDPTLQVGDVLLVEKVTPRLASLLFIGTNKNSGTTTHTRTGDIVLFHPPDQLLDIVRKTGGRITDRDLFIKRIAAQPGDTWSVTKSGEVEIINNLSAERQQQQPRRRDLCAAEPLRLIERYIQPQENVLVQPQQVVVLGDCESVSIDSRVWGPLSTHDIVGRPLLRLWPISRIGPIISQSSLPPPSSSSTSIATPATSTTSTTVDADWSN